jgi:hypothetical protein
MEIKFCEKCKGKETWKPTRAHHCQACGFCVFKVSVEFLTFGRWIITVLGLTTALVTAI